MKREASMISSRCTRRDSLLFVYGTLRPFVDIPMAHWLRRNARYLGCGVTSGRLFDLGPYPAMRAARHSRERVVGDVYRVRRRHVFHVLDRYEAGAAVNKPRFVRERCVVRLTRGISRAAWTYRYRYAVVGAPRIVSGDYREHRSSIG
jgi:gamma-glutamylcyclotransferase (GGCT)/AIG2-like uncharacterized protein YtfP